MDTSFFCAKPSAIIYQNKIHPTFMAPANSSSDVVDVDEMGSPAIDSAVHFVCIYMAEGHIYMYIYMYVVAVHSIHK